MIYKTQHSSGLNENVPYPELKISCPYKIVPSTGIDLSIDTAYNQEQQCYPIVVQFVWKHLCRKTISVDRITVGSDSVPTLFHCEIYTCEI